MRHLAGMFAALSLVVLAGCTGAPEAVKTTATLTAASTATSAAQAPSSSALAPSPSTPDVGQESVPVPGDASVSSVDASARPSCADVLTRGQIGSRIGAGFPDKDVSLEIGPDQTDGTVSGLDCQYAVAASGQWTVSVRLVEFENPDQAEQFVATTASDRVSAGATASSTSVAGYPADLLVTDGALLLMQLGATTLVVEIPVGVLDGPRAQTAVSALAEFCLAQIAI